MTTMAESSVFADIGGQDLDSKPSVSLDTDSATGVSNSTNNKRKRDTSDHDGPEPRAAPGDRSNQATSGSGSADINDHSNFLEVSDPSSNADDMHHFEMLAQHNSDQNGLHTNGTNDVANASDTAAAALSQHYSMTVPASTEMSFQSQASGDANASFNLGNSGLSQDDFQDRALAAFGRTPVPQNNQTPQQSSQTSPQPNKPAVGSEEWHKVRRDNHKEVERRRRETINEGINELAKIVPGCEKNKGSILQRAVQFITQLKENEQQNIEKWTLEKLLTEQAISELSSSCDKLKAECQRAWAEAEQWKKACQAHGIVPDELRDQDHEDEGAAPES